MITGSLVDAVNASPTAWPITSAGAAGRQRGDDLDRPRRPILRPGSGKARDQQRDGEKPATRT